MLRLAIYDPYLDSLGGGEKYTLTFAKTMEKQGWQVDIWWSQDLRDVIKKRFDLDLNSRFIRFDPLKTSLLERLKKTSEYDLIFWVGDGSVPISLAKKTILHMQIPAHWSGSGTLWNKLKAQRLQVVCNSNFTKQVIDQIYRVNSQVLYPPVDVGKFKILDKTNTIISIGRISRMLHAKRQDILVRAFSKLSKIAPKWKLIIAGGSDDNQYLDYLKKQSQGLNIEFLINSDSRKLREVVGKAKLFWSATGFETNPTTEPEKAEHFGIGVVEAMASGCVPLVTRMGGHLETVQEYKSGFFWNSIDELVEQSSKLISDPSLVKEVAYQAHLRAQKFSTNQFEEKVSTILQAS